jgi:hypothetical protein
LKVVDIIKDRGHNENVEKKGWRIRVSIPVPLAC